MSLKKSIVNAIDVSTLVGGSAVMVGGVISTFNAIKNKGGAKVIAGSILVALVGMAAANYSLQSLKKKD